jgi:hypothetical protein
MADVAARTLSKLKVMVGRVISFSVGDGTDKLLTITGMKPDGLTVNEEIKTISHEMEDGQMVEEVLARKVTLDFVFSELKDADIDTINGATIDCVHVDTTTGGANSTGEAFKMDSCDQVYAYNDNLKTHVVAIKASAGESLGWTLTDNAA